MRRRRLIARSLTKAGDYQRSIRVFRDVVAMTPSDPLSHYELAWMLTFVRRYKEAAIIFYFARTRTDVFRVSLKAAKLGDRVAMFETAEFCAAGEGVAADHAKAVNWMERAARAGHVTAMDRLVDIFLNDKLSQKPDDRKAEYWATAARKARTD